METDGGGATSSLVGDGEGSSSRGVRRGCSNAMYQFTQQNLPACKPVLTPLSVITTFFLLGIVFIPVGFVSLHASQTVVGRQIR